MAILPALITRIGLPVIMSVVAGGLSKIDHPAAKEAAQALGHVDAALAGGLISAEQMAEANRHAEAMAHLRAKEFETALTEVNQTMRAEAASDDVYVRRMRPTFGYLMAVTWAGQMTGLAYIITFRPDSAPAILESMEALSTIWAVGLSVLGIYVYKRSEEKKAALKNYVADALNDVGLNGMSRETAPPSAPAGSGDRIPVPGRKPAYNE